MIFPVYKPLGISTHRFVYRIGQKLGEKTTHSGSLDPMADGVVIVLSGQNRFKKKSIANWTKEYSFEILFGISTDSHDLLGKTTQTEQIEYNITQLEQAINSILPDFTGNITQQIPKFAAKRIRGESYFDKAKRGEHFEPDQQKVKIYQLTLNGLLCVPQESIKNNVIEKLSHVKGDFRQREVWGSWGKTFQMLIEKGITTLPIAKLTATTSKRTYIRAIVRDLGISLRIPAATFSLTRTRNGPYSIHRLPPNPNSDPIFSSAR